MFLKSIYGRTDRRESGGEKVGKGIYVSQTTILQIGSQNNA